MSLKVICQVLMIKNPKRFTNLYYKPCDCSAKICKFDLRYFDPKSNKVKYFMEIQKPSGFGL